ncbi:hypothetical protein [Lyngbya sp. PCC 8106]|uniref:hypothetical protein n=1 Tax=Lyngbya sp. (strain PCC 8106) TaxID=313612 RepID=UPI0000EACFA3|nr:hypothetical protein [Lyngbya sp. PCC 8106]EAW33391.1 hypothetical protein L8106_01112 [Lyngbya sp. PCC 8106]
MGTKVNHVDVLNSLTDPLESVREIVTACTDYLKIAEEERTKRQEIKAWEKTTIAQINAQRDVLIEYLERSFDERAKNFRQLFNVVDKAIDNGDNEQLALALHSITELAKSSPFKDLANLTSVKAALNDPNHEWTF